MHKLTCPKCGNTQLYQGTILRGKRKACVYCGKSFDVSLVICRKV